MRKKLIYLWKLLWAKSYYVAVVHKDGRAFRAMEKLDVRDAKLIVDDLMLNASEAIEMENALNDAKNIISGIG